MGKMDSLFTRLRPHVDKHGYSSTSVSLVCQIMELRSNGEGPREQGSRRHGAPHCQRALPVPAAARSLLQEWGGRQSWVRLCGAGV